MKRLKSTAELPHPRFARQEAAGLCLWNNAPRSPRQPRALLWDEPSVPGNVRLLLLSLESPVILDRSR